MLQSSELQLFQTFNGLQHIAKTHRFKVTKLTMTVDVSILQILVFILYMLSKINFSLFLVNSQNTTISYSLIVFRIRVQMGLLELR
jgi:hypothetical protein